MEQATQVYEKMYGNKSSLLEAHLNSAFGQTQFSDLQKMIGEIKEHRNYFRNNNLRNFD